IQLLPSGALGTWIKAARPVAERLGGGAPRRPRSSQEFGSTILAAIGPPPYGRVRGGRRLARPDRRPIHRPATALRPIVPACRSLPSEVQCRSMERGPRPDRGVPPWQPDGPWPN